MLDDAIRELLPLAGCVDCQRCFGMGAYIEHHPTTSDWSPGLVGTAPYTITLHSRVMECDCVTRAD